MQSRTILVVGASRGIGAALVESLSEAGHTVIGAARSPA
jgi:NAD(P)-dependent dehydrogenase (short-subunit alcohol dehydrogenase family)